ncbi:MAG: hypothetical protein QOF97_1101 [Acidimicrobiaceae bacterium]
MSDATQGPGWWQASDGKWYPPEQHPEFTSPTQPVESVPPGPPVAPVAPTQAMAPVPAPPGPPGPPVPPPGAPIAAGGPPPGAGSRGKVIAIAAVAAAILIVAALLLFNRDSGNGTKLAATDSASTNQSDITTTTKKSTTTTSRATTTTRPTTTTTPPVDPAKLKARLLTASEMGSGLVESTFTPDSKNPEACGQPNTDIAFPPAAIVGRSAAETNVRAVVEQVRAYADAATSAKAFDAGQKGVSCSQGNAFDSSGNPTPITIGPVQNITGRVNGSRQAIAVTATGQGFEALVIAADIGGEVAVFQFETTAGAGTETLDARLPIAQAGIDKLRAS